MSSSGPVTDAGSAKVIGEALRFGALGIVNTLFTGAVFLLLMEVLTAQVAYTIAFGTGVIFATVATPRVVFDARPSLARRLAFGGWYLVVYAVGLAVVSVVADVLGLGRLAVVAMTIACTASLGFLGARLLFSSGSRRAPS